MCAILREGQLSEGDVSDPLAASVHEERGEVVLAAAKDLLSSTLILVTADMRGR
jgi:hypothetical protein